MNIKIYIKFFFFLKKKSLYFQLIELYILKN